MGKNEGPIQSRLCIEIHKNFGAILGTLCSFQRYFEVVYISCFSLRIFAVKLRKSSKKVQKSVVLGSLCSGERGCSKFFKCIFKSGSFANIWHSLVELCLVSSDE